MSTLVTIRNNVRRNLGEITANFYSNADLNSFIGEAYKVYSIIMIEEGEGFFEVPTFLDITSGTATITVDSMTPPFFAVSVLWRNTSIAKYPLREKETRYSPVSTTWAASGDNYLPTWKLQGMNIVLEPTPQTSETGSATAGLTLDYNYIPTFPTSVSADSFAFDSCFPTIYEPLVELYATIAAIEAKEGMGGVCDVQTFRDRLSKQEQVFRDSLLRSEMPDRVQYSGTDYTDQTNWRFY